MKYTEKSAIDMIKKNRGTIAGKQISARAGIKVWGAIDYLVGKHGYRTV